MPRSARIGIVVEPSTIERKHARFSAAVTGEVFIDGTRWVSEDKKWAIYRDNFYRYFVFNWVSRKCYTPRVFGGWNEAVDFLERSLRLEAEKNVQEALDSLAPTVPKMIKQIFL